MQEKTIIIPFINNDSFVSFDGDQCHCYRTNSFCNQIERASNFDDGENYFFSIAIIKLFFSTILYRAPSSDTDE